jgi:hypothetical protein
MSARASITKALVEKLKGIDGTNKSNVNNNVYALQKFWDEINDYPAIYVVPTSETREYLPGEFKWGFLNIVLKAYVKSEEPVQDLENLLEDIETIVDANRVLVYDTNAETTEILITSIVTDEGLLVPYGVGEVTLQVRYQVLN